MSGTVSEIDYPKRHLAAGVLCFDRGGALLIVKPIYREDWLIPGGVVEAGESPRQACGREVREELGISLAVGSLLVVDCTSVFTTPRESVQFIFDGGVLDETTIAQIKLPPAELSQFRFVPITQATEVLTPNLARRLPYALRALTSGTPAYLEDGESPVLRRC